MEEWYPFGLQILLNQTNKCVGLKKNHGRNGIKEPTLSEILSLHTLSSHTPPHPSKLAQKGDTENWKIKLKGLKSET